jgi:hypothetical protein
VDRSKSVGAVLQASFAPAEATAERNFIASTALTILISEWGSDVGSINSNYCLLDDRRIFSRVSGNRTEVGFSTESQKSIGV